MKWQFNITESGKNYSCKAEIVYTTYQIEGIKVTGEGLDLLLQNNRPLLQAIELNRPLTWKVMQGKTTENLLPRIQKEIEKQLVQPAGRKLNK